MTALGLIFLVLVSPSGTWPRWGATLHNTRAASTRGGVIDVPAIRWNDLQAGDCTGFGAAIADVDGDGRMEVLIQTRDYVVPDTALVCFDGESGARIWSYPTGGGFPSPACADLDGDGTVEVVCSGDRGTFCVSGPDGGLEWSFPDAGGWWCSPVVADCDGDGAMEVIAGDMAGHLYDLRGADGTERWRATTTAGGWPSTPAVVDVDGDGIAEVFTGSYSGVYCFSGMDGTRRWTTPTSGWPSAVSVADIDGDGHLEAVSGASNGTVYCVSAEDGAMEWTYAAGDWTTGCALADLDRDGTIEVVGGAGANGVFCLRGADGSLIWQAIPGGYVNRAPTVADLGGDPVMEVLVANSGSAGLLCLDGSSGSTRWEITLADYIPSSVVGDIDGDGCAEIVVGSMGGLWALDDLMGASDCDVQPQDGGAHRRQGPAVP